MIDLLVKSIIENIVLCHSSKYFVSLNLVNEFSKTLNKFKMTPLHSACKNNKPEILKFILVKLI